MEDKIAQKEKHYNIQNLRPPWKKGESGNPAGRPKNRVLEALKTLKTKKELREHFNMSAKELDEWEQLLLTLSRPELTRLGNREDLPVYVVSLIKAIMWDYNHGKTSAIDRIRDRQFGATARRVEVSGPGGSPIVSRELSVKEAKEFIDSLEKGL